MDVNGIYSSTHRHDTRTRDILKNELDLVIHDLDFLNSQMTRPLGNVIFTNRSSSLEAATILLEHGADINKVDKDFTTALCAAVKAKNLDMVDLLVKKGADVNLPATQARKRTPLQFAAEVGDFDIVRQLLNYGALVNDAPARQAGGTPLQLAAIKGFFGIAWLLFEHGADVNAEPAKVSGRTALEDASEYGRIDMVQLLLNAGADIEGPRGLRNGLAMQLAEENGHLVTLELLRSYLPPMMELDLDDDQLVDLAAMPGPTFEDQALSAMFPQ